MLRPKLTLAKHVQSLRFVVTMVFGVMLVSCASTKTITSNKSAAASGLAKYGSNFQYTTDKDGMTRSTSDKVSSFAQKGAYGVTQNSQAKNFRSASYSKKSWNKNVSTLKKRYGNKTDANKFKSASYYAQKKAGVLKDSRFNGSKYGTNSVAKKNANESSGTVIKKDENGYASSQGEYSKGLILSREEYNEVSIQETNSLLGREDK